MVLGEFLSAVAVQTANFFGSLLTGVDYLPHTHSLKHNVFSRKQPEWGAHLAHELERIVALHDASNIAAVIVEPVAGSTGVLIPPKGYLERLRAICDKYGILLIFDEVITRFGRVGSSFATEYFGVVPDIVTSEFQRWYKPPDLSVESIPNLKSKILKPPHLSVGSI